MDTVWTQRPNIPTWQKVTGTIAWPVMLLTPHGWLFLAATFVMMVVLGHETPYGWAQWITKWGSVFLLVTAALAAIVLLIAASSSSGTNGY